jgi:hypothetical protein
MCVVVLQGVTNQCHEDGWLIALIFCHFFGRPLLYKFSLLINQKRGLVGSFKKKR